MEYWRDELYHYGIKGMKWGKRKYLNTRSDYDGLTKAERVLVDKKEYDNYNKMSPEEQKLYIAKMRSRQKDYISKGVTLDGVHRSHEDNRYNLIDKAREHITGELDADHANNLRKKVIENETANSSLVANNRWGEEIEAKMAKDWGQKRLNTAIENAQNALFRNKVDRFLKKLFHK